MCLTAFSYKVTLGNVQYNILRNQLKQKTQIKIASGRVLHITQPRMSSKAGVPNPWAVSHYCASLFGTGPHEWQAGTCVRTAPFARVADWQLSYAFMCVGLRLVQVELHACYLCGSPISPPHPSRATKPQRLGATESHKANVPSRGMILQRMGGQSQN